MLYSSILVEHTWEMEKCLLCVYDLVCFSITIVHGVLWLVLCRISMKRESAVSKEVLADLSSGSGKKLTKAEKDERFVNLWVNSALYTINDFVCFLA